jgi:hypothetical protein
MMGFKALHSASATIAGIEVAHMIRKKQFANDNRSPFEVFAGCCHVKCVMSIQMWGLNFQTRPAALLHASNASRRWKRIVCALRRWDGTEKRFRVAECMDTNRCNAPGDR